MKKIFLFVSTGSLLLLGACKKSFLEVPPQGAALTIDKLSNKAGVQELLVGAYHDLTGVDTKSTWWGTSGTNWVYGDITSGDTYLGGASAVNSQPHEVTDAFNIENFQALATTGFIDDKWIANYDGVARANAVIIAATNAKDMSVAEKTEAIAEARFLRGHFHFQAKETWNNVPYVDETVAGADFRKLSNTTDIWPKIEADFQFAYANLLERQPLTAVLRKAFHPALHRFPGAFRMAVINVVFDMKIGRHFLEYQVMVLMVVRDNDQVQRIPKISPPGKKTFQVLDQVIFSAVVLRTGINQHGPAGKLQQRSIGLPHIDEMRPHLVTRYWLGIAQIKHKQEAGNGKKKEDGPFGDQQVHDSQG